MLLAELVEVSDAITATSARGAKSDAIAAALRAAAPQEIEVVVAYLSGELRQRRTGVGWAALAVLPPAARAPSLTVAEADAAFARIAALAGGGSQAARRNAVDELFARATAPEQRFLAALAGGELRQGALDGVMLDGIAKASATAATAVRRATMLRGAAGPVAVAALVGGGSALAGFGLEVGRGVRPMLATSAPTVAEAAAKLGGAFAADAKLDGIRIQVHRDGAGVRVLTRSLDDITARVPEVVAAVAALPATALVLDGEAIALRADGSPEQFQLTAARTASHPESAALTAGLPLSAVFFDLLHRDGADLLDAPARERFAALEALAPPQLVVARLPEAGVAEAEAFFADTVAQGHEGVVLKALDAPYQAGRRGSAWIKVKPRHTLDLVVLAAEWGHGRRRGRLSNLHLGARDAAGGGFVMLGKTFKGMTDALLEWQTAELLARETSRDRQIVHVRPDLVVEIAFDGVQTSSRYPGGVTLRFARVLRYRDDKLAADADTIEAVRALHRGGEDG